MELLALFLEKNFLSKLNFKECLRVKDAKCKVIADKLFYLMTEQPITVLDRNMSYWAKRIFSRIFLGSNVPLALEADQQQKGVKQPIKQPVTEEEYDKIYDPIWSATEAVQQERADA